MIYTVIWDEYESDYDARSGEIGILAGDSALLIAVDSLDVACDKIKEHQDNNEDVDYQYGLQFWLGGEQVAASLIDIDQKMDDECRQQLKELQKNVLN